MKIDHDLEGITIQFDSDSSHPWPYYEGLSGSHGMHFSFLIPRAVPKEEIKNYLQKLRNQRDVTGITLYRS